MEQLLTLLKELYDDQNNVYQEDGFTGFNECDIYNEVTALCDEYLIGNGGSCNWDNIWILRDNGYRVFAGEKDSFGWLTGCVQKQGDPRIIVYG